MGFHGEALLAPRPTPNLEDHPLSVVRDCLFNLFAATLHIGRGSSIRNLRTRHAVVTGTPYDMARCTILLVITQNLLLDTLFLLQGTDVRNSHWSYSCGM